MFDSQQFDLPTFFQIYKLYNFLDRKASSLTVSAKVESREALRTGSSMGGYGACFLD